MMRAIYVPIPDASGQACLYDIYIDGEWHGSQRSLDQAEAYVRHRRLTQTTGC
jgi:hypothetical protein